MHTKPISTEVIASCKATLTSGFASMSDTILKPKPHSEVQLFDNDLIYRLSNEPGVGSINLARYAQKFAEFIGNDVTEKVRQIDEEYSDHSDQDKKNAALAAFKDSLDDHHRTLFQTVLYLNEPDENRMLVSKPYEILFDLREIYKFDEKDVEEFRKKFFEIYEFDEKDVEEFPEGSVYDYRHLHQSMKDEGKNSKVYESKFHKDSELYRQLLDFMAVPTIDDATKMKIHQLLLPFLLLEDKESDERNDFLSLSKFYETLAEANAKAILPSGAPEQTKREVEHDGSLRNAVKNVEFILKGRTIAAAFQALAEMKEKHEEEPSEDFHPTPIYHTLYDYHMQNKRYAALSACSKLATCFDESDAKSLYNDIYYFRAFVETFEESVKNDQKDLIKAMDQCEVASKYLIARFCQKWR